MISRLFAKKKFLFKFVFLLCFFCFLNACWVEVEGSRRLVGQTDASYEKGVPLDTLIKSDPNHCFRKFRQAVIEKKWPLAYEELSSRWRYSRTLDQFRANMELVKASKRLWAERMINVQTSEYKSMPYVVITTMGMKKFRTKYVLIQEGKEWKIDRVKNLPPDKKYEKLSKVESVQ